MSQKLTGWNPVGLNLVMENKSTILMIGACTLMSAQA